MVRVHGLGFPVELRFRVEGLLSASFTLAE